MNSTTLRLRLQLLHQLLEVLEVDQLDQRGRPLAADKFAHVARHPIPGPGEPIRRLRRLRAVQRMEVMKLSMKTMSKGRPPATAAPPLGRRPPPRSSRTSPRGQPRPRSCAERPPLGSQLDLAVVPHENLAQPAPACTAAALRCERTFHDRRHLLHRGRRRERHRWLAEEGIGGGLTWTLRADPGRQDQGEVGG
jgi:hypothetical protein